MNFTHKFHHRFKELHKFYITFPKITGNTFLFLSQYYLSKSKKSQHKKVQPTSLLTKTKFLKILANIIQKYVLSIHDEQVVFIAVIQN